MKYLFCWLFFSIHALFALEIDQVNNLVLPDLHNNIILTTENDILPLETSKLNNAIISNNNDISQSATISQFSLANQNLLFTNAPSVNPEPATIFSFLFFMAFLFFKRKRLWRRA